MRIRSGQLNRRVGILAPAAVNDSKYGKSPSAGHSNIGKVWARMRWTGTKEIYEAQKRNSEVSLELVIRYRKDITSAHKFKFGDVAYEVEGEPIDVGDRRKWLKILCKVSR